MAGSAIAVAAQGIFLIMVFTSMDNTLQDISETLEDLSEKTGDDE